jgi:hypothetical protein
LVPIERNIALVDRLFARALIDVQQPLHDLLLSYGLSYDLGDVFRLDLDIADVFGRYDHDGASLTEPRAAGPFGVHLGVQALVLDLGFESGDDFTRTACHATRAGTNRNAGFAVFLPGQQPLPELLQLVSRSQKWHLVSLGLVSE